MGGQPFARAAAAASAVSPDGSLFAVSPGPDRVSLWRASTRTPASPPLRGPVGYVGAIAFSPGRKLIAAAGSRHTVVWDLNSRKVDWLHSAARKLGKRSIREWKEYCA